MLVSSWAEHLRQFARMTKAETELVERVWAMSTQPIPDVEGRIETPAAANSAVPMALLPLDAQPSGAGPAPGTTRGSLPLDTRPATQGFERPWPFGPASNAQ